MVRILMGPTNLMREPNGITLELGSSQTRSWRTASNRFAGPWQAFRSPQVPSEKFIDGLVAMRFFCHF